MCVCVCVSVCLCVCVSVCLCVRGMTGHVPAVGLCLRVFKFQVQYEPMSFLSDSQRAFVCVSVCGRLVSVCVCVL